MQRAQSARFFRVVSGEGEGEERYAPCEEGERGAVEMTWEGVPRNKLWEAPVTAEDFKRVLGERRVKSSVGMGELRKYEEWTEEFGVEGST